MLGIVSALGIIFLGFCVYLFLRIILLKRKKSNFCFLHLLWIYLLISTLIFRTRSTTELMENPLDAAGLFRVSLVSFVFLVSIAYFALTKKRTLFKRRDFLLYYIFIYFVIGFVSFVYSPLPYLTLYKSFEVLTDVLLLALILAYDKFEYIESIIKINYAFLFFLILSAWFWVPMKPDEAIIKGGVFNFILKGAFPLQDADMVTVHAALLAIAFYIRSNMLPYKYNISRIIFLVALVTMIAGQARTSIIGFLVTLSLYFLLRKQRIKLIGMLVLIFISLQIDKIMDFLYRFFLKGVRPEIVMKIGGRLEWWRVAFSQFLKSPWIGYGLGAGGRSVAYNLHIKLISVYNGFLEIALNLGILGLFSFLMAYLGTFKGLIKGLKSSMKNANKRLYSLVLESLGMMSILTFRAMTSLTFGEHGTTMLIFLSILGLSQLLLRKNR